MVTLTEKQTKKIMVSLFTLEQISNVKGNKDLASKNYKLLEKKLEK